MITIAINRRLEGDIAAKVDIINLDSKLTQSIAETNRNLAEVKRQLDKHDEQFGKIKERLFKQDILLASINNNLKWVYAIGGSAIILFLGLLVLLRYIQVFAL